jgi:hypothetical protein
MIICANHTLDSVFPLPFSSISNRKFRRCHSIRGVGDSVVTTTTTWLLLLSARPLRPSTSIVVTSTVTATTARPGTPRRCTALTRRLAVAVAQRLGNRP